MHFIWSPVILTSEETLGLHPNIHLLRFNRLHNGPQVPEIILNHSQRPEIIFDNIMMHKYVKK